MAGLRYDFLGAVLTYSYSSIPPDIRRDALVELFFVVNLHVIHRPWQASTHLPAYSSVFNETLRMFPPVWLGESSESMLMY